MKGLISILLIVLRICVFVKVIYLLYMTKRFPSDYPMNDLIWWICYLCFDIWLQFILPNENEKED